MDEKRRIEENLNTLTSFKLLAQAHEEVSIIRMRLAKGKVLATRDFLSSLSEIFINVKTAYKKHLQEEIEKNKVNNQVEPVNGRKKNGREIFVFLSANNKLYGEIIPKVFSLFLKKCRSTSADIAIVGKLGKELFESSDVHKPYRYFEIIDNEKEFIDVKPLTAYIQQFENVTIFYGKFLNIVTQDAVFSNISGEESFVEHQQNKKEFDFIFEPSIEKVLDFFESQMFSSLFKQTVQESELARFGSRIKAMEQALERIRTEMAMYALANRRVKNLLANKKQLERISGISIWG